MTDDDARFQLAADAARRIVRQCRTHVDTSTLKYAARLATAPASTPYGIEAAAAAQGQHKLALQWKVAHAEATSNAMLSHLRGLDILLQQGTFYPLPAMPIARSIAEIAASTSWALAANVEPDERAARGYAGLFRSLEKSISGSLSSDAERHRVLREGIVQDLAKSGVRVVRHTKKGISTDEASQVIVGRAHAKTRFQYSQRVAEEIPTIGETYSGMSGVVHGEQIHLSTSWLVPDTYARLIGLVVQESVEAWSRAMHTWVGVQPGLFINPNERFKLIHSVPEQYRAAFDAEDAQASAE